MHESPIARAHIVLLTIQLCSMIPNPLSTSHRPRATSSGTSLLIHVLNHDIRKETEATLATNTPGFGLPNL
ncbi:hypothetical protein SCLCIDRAFT_1225060, partial [Scleroderma citrinum Foug A]